MRHLPTPVLHARPPLRGVLLHLHRLAQQDLEGDARHVRGLRQGGQRGQGADREGAGDDPHLTRPAAQQAAVAYIQRDNAAVAAGEEYQGGVGVARQASGGAEGADHPGHPGADQAAAARFPG